MPIIAMHQQHQWQATACNLEVPPWNHDEQQDGWTHTHTHLNCISYSYLHATVLLQVRRLLGLGGTVCWSALPSCTFQLFLPAIRKAPWPPLWDMQWWMVHWCFFHRAPGAWALWCEHLTLVATFDPPCSHVPLDSLSWCRTCCARSNAASGSRSVFALLSVLVHRGRSYLQPHKFCSWLYLYFSSFLVNWILCGLLLCQEFLAITHISTFDDCGMPVPVYDLICHASSEILLCLLAFRGCNIICVRIKACLFTFPYYEREQSFIFLWDK